MAETFLLVRAADLVVLLVRWEGCQPSVTATGSPVLTATGPGARILVTFPPQAILEQTTSGTGFGSAGLVHSDSRMTQPSQVSFKLAQGTIIGLTCTALLQALDELDVTATSIGMPWGLRLAPTARSGGSTVSEHPGAPVSGEAGSFGLWQARIVAADGDRYDARLVVRPQLVSELSGMADRPQFSAPPLENSRKAIVAAANDTAGGAAPAALTRLELSALGGSLSASAKWSSLSWIHDLRQGRDQRVHVTASGRLWPFGHRALFVEHTSREFLPFSGSSAGRTIAALRTVRTLVILQPIRTGLRGRFFPFDEVEVGSEKVTNLAPVSDVTVFIPKDLANKPIQIPMRCRTGTTDVGFSMPVIFVGDSRTSPPAPFLNEWQPLASVEVPGVEIDLIGGGRPGDIQQVHSLSFEGQANGSEFRPALNQFAVVLPALRELLPNADHHTPRALRYAMDSAGPIPEVPLRFLNPVGVDFTRNTDRSGGLVAPKFTADGVARELGPVAAALVNPPNLESAIRSALGDARLFGFSLPDLIETATANPKPGPPKIIRHPGSGIEFLWEKIQLKSHGPFQAVPNAAPPRLDLRIDTRVAGAEPPKPTCAISNFQIAVPPSKPILKLAFERVAIFQQPGRPMRMESTMPKVTFEQPLTLLQELQVQVAALLGSDLLPKVTVSSTEVVMQYLLPLPKVAAGMFVLRDVSAMTRVTVPFGGDPVAVAVGFSAREKPFGLSVYGIGGGGYAAVDVAGDRPSKVELSMEFGGMLDFDFVIVKAEVHALGGVRLVLDPAGGHTLEAYIRVGGTVELLGLISVSVELRVELGFAAEPTPRLFGRASLVIELDLTLYSDSVTLDTGTIELIGGRDPVLEGADVERLAAPIRAAADREAQWLKYWEAFV